MVECVIRWRMEVEIVNIRPVAFIVIVQQADGTRTEKHDGVDGLLFLWLLQLSSKSTLYPEARNPHRIRWQSRSRDEAIPSDGSQKNNPKRSSRIRKCLLFVCAKQKKTIFGVRWCKTEMQKKSSSGPAAATCRLGSWRPTGEVPLHLGRAMMMMHTSWSLASDTALKTPVHIFLSLCYLPALNTWSQKAFFSNNPSSYDDWLFLSLSRSAPFSLSWIPTKKYLLFFLFGQWFVPNEP